ncbi:MAG: hypothetical protein ACFFFG_15140 [Candidatus Thorarchaeota archaeon]
MVDRGHGRTGESADSGPETPPEEGHPVPPPRPIPPQIIPDARSHALHSANGIRETDPLYQVVGQVHFRP